MRAASKSGDCQEPRQTNVLLESMFRLILSLYLRADLATLNKWESITQAINTLQIASSPIQAWKWYLSSYHLPMCKSSRRLGAHQTLQTKSATPNGDVQFRSQLDTRVKNVLLPDAKSGEAKQKGAGQHVMLQSDLCDCHP